MRCFSVIFVFVMVLSSAVYSQELRAGAELSKEVVKDIDTELMFQGRAGEDGMESYGSLVSELGVRYTRFKYFQLGAIVRYKYTNVDKLSVNDIDGDFRYTGDIIVKIPENIDRAKLKYRLRYQLAGDKNNDYSEYLRNRIKYQQKLSSDFSSAMSYELFYDLEKSRIDGHRVKLSLDYNISKSMSLSNFFIVGQSFIAPCLDPNAKRLKYKYTLGIMAIFKI